MSSPFDVGLPFLDSEVYGGPFRDTMAEETVLTDLTYTLVYLSDDMQISVLYRHMQKSMLSS